jgi:hypothetical protein
MKPRTTWLYVVAGTCHRVCRGQRGGAGDQGRQLVAPDLGELAAGRRRGDLAAHGAVLPAASPAGQVNHPGR